MNDDTSFIDKNGKRVFAKGRCPVNSARKERRRKIIRRRTPR